jgi:hypothetical protein
MCDIIYIDSDIYYNGRINSTELPKYELIELIIYLFVSIRNKRWGVDPNGNTNVKFPKNDFVEWKGEIYNNDILNKMEYEMLKNILTELADDNHNGCVVPHQHVDGYILNRGWLLKVDSIRDNCISDKSYLTKLKIYFIWLLTVYYNMKLNLHKNVCMQIGQSRHNVDKCKKLHFKKLPCTMVWYTKGSRQEFTYSSIMAMDCAQEIQDLCVDIYRHIYNI